MACISIGTGISRCLQVCMLQLAIPHFTLCMGMRLAFQWISYVDALTKRTFHIVNMWPTCRNAWGMFLKVRDRTGQKQVRQKTYYDKKTHGEVLPTGSLVWLWNPAVPQRKGYNCKKLHQAWWVLFEIVQRLSDVTYRIRHTTNRRQRLVVHFDHLPPL